MVWCRSRKKDEEQRPFEVDGKEIFSNRSKQAKPKAGEKKDKKGGKGQSVCWKAWWRQGNIKCAVSEEYVGSPRLPCGRRAKSSFEEHQEITRVISLCRLIYNVMSFKPFNDIIMIVCKFRIGLCCLRSYST